LLDWQRIVATLPHAKKRLGGLLLLLLLGPMGEDNEGLLSNDCWLAPCGRIGEASLYLYRAYVETFVSDAAAKLFLPQNECQFAASALPLIVPHNYSAPSHAKRLEHVAVHHPALCEIRKQPQLNDEEIARSTMLLRRRQGHRCCRPTHINIASSATNRQQTQWRLEAEQRFGVCTSDTIDQRRQKLAQCNWLKWKMKGNRRNEYRCRSPPND